MTLIKRKSTWQCVCIHQSVLEFIELDCVCVFHWLDQTQLSDPSYTAANLVHKQNYRQMKLKQKKGKCHIERNKKKFAKASHIFLSMKEAYVTVLRWNKQADTQDVDSAVMHSSWGLLLMPWTDYRTLRLKDDYTVLHIYKVFLTSEKYIMIRYFLHKCFR